VSGTRSWPGKTPAACQSTAPRKDLASGLPGESDRSEVAHLLQERGPKPGDLAGVLPKSRASEVLTGRRAISKDQAKGLAEFFRVPVELFL